MAVSGAADYINTYTGYTDTVKKGDSTKESTVKTSVVELKTSVPGVTKTERIKTGYSNVNDYSKYLQGKYSYMNKGAVSMQGIPTTVTVSGAFLKKCMNDPEKAKYLEENLAAIPDCVSYATSHASGTVTSISYEIDGEGNITGIMSGTNDPDGKIARENAERKAKEEKAAKRRKEKKAEEERAAKRRSERREERDKTEAGGEPEIFTISATGRNVKNIVQNMAAVSDGTSTSYSGSFDRKA